MPLIPRTDLEASATALATASSQLMGELAKTSKTFNTIFYEKSPLSLTAPNILCYFLKCKVLFCFFLELCNGFLFF